MPARPLADLPPASWGRNPGYVIDLVALPLRLRAVFAGATILDSRAASVMFELGHAPVYYVPRADVAHAQLEATDHASHCPYKGDASYWTVAVGDRAAENAVWAYRDPYPEMAALGGLMGVYWDRMDGWFHDEAPAAAPVDIAGRTGKAQSFAALYPALAAEWDRDANPRLQPYEFAATSATAVGWHDAGRRWRQPIRDRVVAWELARAAAARAAE